MAIVTTPSLLTPKEQKDLTTAWKAAVMGGLRQARRNVASAVRLGMVPRGSQPQEPDYVYGLFQAAIPTMQAELVALFAKHLRSVVLAGVFCHQSPRVSFRVRNSSSWGEMACELGDLLVVVRHQESWGEELSALLLQFKMDHWPTANLADAQWRLYTEWPPFDWDFAPYRHRNPHPSGPHAGALHAVIEGGGKKQPLARAADATLQPRYLGTMLSGATMLFGGRSIKPRALARAEAQAGWSEVIWDLIDDTSKRVLNRKRSGAVNESRGSGTPVLLDVTAGVSELLRESLVAVGAKRSEIADIWRDAQRLYPDDQPPPGPTPRDAADDGAGGGGISMLVIEISGGEQTER